MWINRGWEQVCVYIYIRTCTKSIRGKPVSRNQVLLGQLPNYQLEQLELVEHLTVQVQHPDAGPLHARPGCQAEIEAVLERALADREAPLQLGAGYGRETIPPIQHRVPPVARRRLHPSARDQPPLDLGAGQGRIPVATIQRRGFPVQVLLGDRGAPGPHHRRVPRLGRADGPFLGLGNPHPDPLGLSARRRDAGHPHLHLGPLLAARRPLRTHPRPRAREQRRRRVTPLKFVVQDWSLEDASSSWIFIVPLSLKFLEQMLFIRIVSSVMVGSKRPYFSRGSSFVERKDAGKTVEQFLENHAPSYFHRAKKLIEPKAAERSSFRMVHSFSSFSLPFAEKRKKEKDGIEGNGNRREREEDSVLAMRENGACWTVGRMAGRVYNLIRTDGRWFVLSSGRTAGRLSPEKLLRLDANGQAEAVPARAPARIYFHCGNRHGSRSRAVIYRVDHPPG